MSQIKDKPIAVEMDINRDADGCTLTASIRLDNDAIAYLKEQLTPLELHPKDAQLQVMQGLIKYFAAGLR